MVIGQIWGQIWNPLVTLHHNVWSKLDFLTTSEFDKLTYFRCPIFQNWSELGQIWDNNIKGLDARNSHVKDECCSSTNKGDMTKNVKRSNGWPLVDLDLWPGKYWWKTCFVIVYDPLDLFWHIKSYFENSQFLTFGSHFRGQVEVKGQFWGQIWKPLIKLHHMAWSKLHF